MIALQFSTQVGLVKIMVVFVFKFQMILWKRKREDRCSGHTINMWSVTTSLLK